MKLFVWFFCMEDLTLTRDMVGWEWKRRPKCIQDNHKYIIYAFCSNPVLLYRVHCTREFIFFSTIYWFNPGSTFLDIPPHRFFISLEFSEYFYIFDIFVLNQTYNLKEDLLNIKRYNKNAWKYQNWMLARKSCSVLKAQKMFHRLSLGFF